MNKIISITVAVASLMLLSAIALGAEQKAIPPTYSDVSYGSDLSQKMDVWLAKSTGKSPVVMHIHGGGWMSGDKKTVKEGKSADMLSMFLGRGISVIAINYRLSTKAPLPAPVHDAARAIQFIRYKAEEWNLDKDRIAVIGGSAGGCTCLWLAFHDDLADAKSNDPVLRESTRVCGAAVQNGQASIDPAWVKENIGKEAAKNPMICNAVGEKSLDDVLKNYEKYKPLYWEYSPINHLDKNDPPVYLTYNGSSTVPAETPGAGIHHRMFGVKLKEKSIAVGHKAYLNGRDENTYTDGNAFLLDVLGAGERK